MPQAEAWGIVVFQGELEHRPREKGTAGRPVASE
jgi:hypothetical protein